MSLITLFPTIIIGTNKADVLNGTTRADVISGLGGNDQIFGNAGNDELLGWNGDDKLFGGDGNDALWGGNGHDLLSGGAGNDHFYGGYGNDRLVGATGNDVLTGGANSDKFFFDPSRVGEGADHIIDFNGNLDKIVLKLDDILASTPGVLSLSGSSTQFEATDLDCSLLWDLSASSDGDLVITHPNGSIEIDTINFSAVLTFADVLPMVELVPASAVMTV